MDVSVFTSLAEMYYGPADGYPPVTSCVSGRVVEVAWKNGIVSLEMNVGSRLTRRITSLYGPFTWTPRTCVACPAFTAWAPRMFTPFGSVMKAAPGDARSLFAVRSIAYAKLFAVTGEPSLKRKFLRRKNVYLRPSFEIATRDATSGTSLLPRSVQLQSFAAVAYSSHQPVET